MQFNSNSRRSRISPFTISQQSRLKSHNIKLLTKIAAEKESDIDAVQWQINKICTPTTPLKKCCTLLNTKYIYFLHSGQLAIKRTYIFQKLIQISAIPLTRAPSSEHYFFTKELANGTRRKLCQLREKVKQVHLF